MSEAAVPNSADDRRGGTCVELFHVPDLGGAHDADDALSVRLSVRVKESLDCVSGVSLVFHLFLIQLIHVMGCRHLHVHERLLLLVLLLLLVFALVLHLLRCLLLLYMRMPQPCTVHVIQQPVERVPRAQGGPKVEFPVRTKICVLSQRWRQE